MTITEVRDEIRRVLINKYDRVMYVSDDDATSFTVWLDIASEDVPYRVTIARAS